MALRLDSRLRGNDEMQTFLGLTWFFAKVSGRLKCLNPVILGLDPSMTQIFKVST